ncbi:hypothetical protein IWW48_004979 [Coemansia sp. RSA 1200]|nr:hypothetical protein IWW48_004979 [Coemansia sp. RSA 1200]
MSPVGHYLSTVHNEEELVLTVADAMKCHNTILTKCRLLHRDISVNNILVVREFEGRSVRRPVKGLLIDYDHAISIDKEFSGCATRSGTLPFMSIHNLMGHDSKRTALDDWESLLYLICWQATFGINNADRKNVKADKVVAEVLKWRDGDMVDIANEKRKQMHSLDTFKSTILAGFQDQYVLLKMVAVALYEALFQHKGCEGALLQLPQLLQLKRAVMSQGFRKHLDAIKQPSIRNDQSMPNSPAKSKGDQASSKQPDSDPLVNRKLWENAIIDELLKIIKDASVLAEEFLGDTTAKQRIVETFVQ